MKSGDFKPKVCGKYASQGSSRAYYINAPLDPTQKEGTWHTSSLGLLVRVCADLMLIGEGGVFGVVAWSEHRLVRGSYLVVWCSDQIWCSEGRWPGVSDRWKSKRTAELMAVNGSIKRVGTMLRETEKIKWKWIILRFMSAKEVHKLRYHSSVKNWLLPREDNGNLSAKDPGVIFRL